MFYKIIKISLFLILFSCVTKPLEKKDTTTHTKSFFLNKGFTLVYNDDLYIEKLIKGKIEDRSLIIFQKNLKKNTTVKITNLLNSKYLIAKVGKKTEYPYFYNSIISKRISNELKIDEFEPYVEIKQIVEGSSFIAKEAKTYDEEKNVADKAPVDNIQIKEIGKDSKKKKKVKKKKFNYILKIADFYFQKSANQMKSRISDETTIKKVHIDKLSATKFRVFLGPFSNLNSLKKSFNAINILEFDNIEFIKE